MRYIVILPLFVVACLLIFNGCGGENHQVADSGQIQPLPDQESWDATIVITREGNRIGYLKAGYIEKYSKRKVTHLSDGITVDFFNEDGDHTSVLHAQGGKVYDQKQDMFAYGNVVVESDSGVTLYTDTLQWDNKRRKIISEIPVMITTEEQDTLYGDSFISDPDLINYEISNPRGKTSRAIDVE